jgi:uncharacterized membrane protein YraQ (UPF0718 family)
MEELGVFEMNNLLTAGTFFAIIVSELILIFIAVSFLIGVITEYLPPEKIREFLSRRFKWLGYLLGAGFGALTPFCSCSTVPITAGLLQGGVPFGPSTAFLFSSPILNPVIIALFWTLMGYKVTLIYVLVTFLSSMAAAMVLSRLGMEKEVKLVSSFSGACCSEKLAKTEPLNLKVQIPAASSCAEKPGTMEKIVAMGSCCAASPGSANTNVVSSRDPFVDKMKRAFLFAVGTFKQVFWYLLLGAGIGALIYGFFPQDLVVKLAGPGNPFSIPIAAAIGVPMYIRAETVIPISAALVGKGMGMGTVLALIIGGAGASIPEITLLASLFKRKLLMAFILNVFLVAIVAGYLVDHFLY